METPTSETSGVVALLKKRKAEMTGDNATTLPETGLKVT